MTTVVFLFAVISIALACSMHPSPPPPPPTTRPPPPATHSTSTRVPTTKGVIYFKLKEMDKFVDNAKKELDKFIRDGYAYC
ncbi:hypothetical protein ANCDUO_13827 [Ancylostoma duodenale]|uniref:Uncharacterized protein n=1 Tax=Ancylostoma duodenale TaxID=51022 RepID=A0A0C2G4T9_9BILA|nr:hypothetical protein ANCDUO_13827 [Ancylostoma duodenale]